MTQETNLILEQFLLGPMNNFLYFIGCRKTKKVGIIDPAWDADKISKKAQELGIIIDAILLTHCHLDHLNALEDLATLHNVPIYVSAQESALYKPEHPNIRDVHPNEVLSIGNATIKCIHTPGHTPGSQCFLIGNYLLTGDTLFIDGCGRCDLPGGNAAIMYQTLYETIKKLPDDTIILPGHDYGTQSSATLGEQKKTNPYLSCQSLEEFLETRM